VGEVDRKTLFSRLLSDGADILKESIDFGAQAVHCVG
jgi:hypothetical protein